MTKINILSQERFHMLDLARELDHTGFDIKFYSFIPTSRCIKFGLQKMYSFSIWYNSSFSYSSSYFPQTILDSH